MDVIGPDVADIIAAVERVFGSREDADA